MSEIGYNDKEDTKMHSFSFIHISNLRSFRNIFKSNLHLDLCHMHILSVLNTGNKFHICTGININVLSLHK